MNTVEQQFFNDLEKKLWTAADKLRSSLDASVYKHVVLGLLAAELEVRDYYTEKNVVWVPLEARCQTLRDGAQFRIFATRYFPNSSPASGPSPRRGWVLRPERAGHLICCCRHPASQRLLRADPAVERRWQHQTLRDHGLGQTDRRRR